MWSQVAWAWITDPPITSYLNLSQLHDLSKSQLLHLQKEDANSAHYIRWS